MPREDVTYTNVVIIGAGMSGLCMAIRLKQSGEDDFLVVESADDVGGCWLKNSYPNAACDVPSWLYSYSFARRHDWSRKYAGQPEILDYLQHCATRFQIRSHLRLGSAVKSATFDELSRRWRLETENGETLLAKVVISAVGQLDRPYIPAIPGLQEFPGPVWHSARWNHDYDFQGQTVGVIGNGASAVQFVPRVAERAARTILFQRSPNWIHPRHDYAYSRRARWALRNLPGCGTLHRFWFYLCCESRFLAFQEGSWLNREYARWLRRKMKRLVPEEQWENLIPNYSPGCKRILLSNDYLPALQRANVQVVSEPVQQLESESVITGCHRYRVDALILATGFQATGFLQPMAIRGRGGQTIEDVWQGRPRAFFGMATPGFPNLFMLYGPNTNLGHNSTVFMVERQVNYVLRCLRKIRKKEFQLMEITPQAMQQFDEDTQGRLGESVWAGDCSSWYKTSDGRQPNNWWGSATAYWWRTRRPNFAHFHFQ